MSRLLLFHPTNNSVVPTIFLKQWRLAIFFHNDTALCHVQGFQLFSIGDLPQIFSFSWLSVALYLLFAGVFPISSPLFMTFIICFPLTLKSSSRNNLLCHDLAQPLQFSHFLVVTHAHVCYFKHCFHPPLRVLHS